MVRKIFLTGAAAFLFSTGAQAGAQSTTSACPSVTAANLKTQLQGAIADVQANSKTAKLALGLNMWATITAPDGRVCTVVYSSTDAIQGQWLASRVISAQKAFTAVSLSLGLKFGKLALSTANLYAAVQPGGSLYGLASSNPVAGAEAYGDKINTSTGSYIGPTDTGTYGTAFDPMIGLEIGGINTFGGGLALYQSGGSKVGGLGVSGDTSCADHFIAWYLRKRLNLDYLANIGGVSGDTKRPDNAVFDIAASNGGPANTSTSGWGQPSCLGVSNSDATAAAGSLPIVH